MKTLANLIFSLSFWIVAPVVFATTVSEVASQLICTCGCSMIVSDCNCGTADDIRTLIQRQIDQGMDRPGIMNYFASQYGEKVLAAPTKSGFNLTAWTMPFIALLIAIVMVTAVIRRWVRSGQESGTRAMPNPSPPNSADRERLKRELDGFDA